MSRRDLLIEIGTEELPPKSLATLSQAFTDFIANALTEQQLENEGVQSFASPRRLAVLFKQLQEQAPEKTVEQWGPPLKVALDAEGNPSKAGLAFAEKNGINPTELKNFSRNDGKQDKLFISKTEAGAETKSQLVSIVSGALAALPIAKRMRWGASREQFVRPVHWASIIFGEEALQGEIMGLALGNTTRGHRFHSSGEIALSNAADYESLLKEQGRVIACFNTRREMIRQQVIEQGSKLGGTAVIDEDLLNEVTALVEWPVALSGRFEERFLKVPAEALVSSMKEHQKYFHVVDANGSLMPHFITVSNIESSDPQRIVDGNERVIRPRLSDAAFFFEVDCKTTLEARREKLKTVVFQDKLGTIYNKTERLEKLAAYLADKLGVEAEQPVRAAALCKSDLVSEMVFEFDDMQGIAGQYYARNDGETEDVAQAMHEQYLPAFAGDKLPETMSGTIVALADRLDTISGIFGIGQIPTGSKDPFALRRASLGVLRIIIEKDLPLDLKELIETALQQHPGISSSVELLDTTTNYILDRLQAWYEDQGISVEMFRAVSARGITAPSDFHRRILAVQSFSQLAEAQPLAAANKRVGNILEKSDAADISGEIDSKLLEAGAEQQLADAISASTQDIAPLLEAGDYQQVLTQLSVLKEPVDQFFDQVMVNAEDPALRQNRLRLLTALRTLFLEVADISQLVPAKD
ncbi:glycine--tRNA ligase subunit beta [Spongiibacter sp. KMU-158]|uniref:Glycine--tRNA ligase beta subunit n=1 Tax=Spongiibacter pelagi TaxID=2760804 RepID=A0A927BXX7_9GAMM|nr:glycine--tRNA ligase subunit beta [Spongiibacter pelagi]MBD2857594.1 glycine--tRNA ligase subunit beta [Spongiibacter pelagi]